jgi:hypothetical protein
MHSKKKLRRGITMRRPKKCRRLAGSELMLSAIILVTSVISASSGLSDECVFCHNPSRIVDADPHHSTEPFQSGNCTLCHAPHSTDGCLSCHPDSSQPDVIVIQEKLSGRQGLFVYETPPALSGETEPPVVADRHFGHSNQGNRVVALACVDTDGDGLDEIAIIRQRPGGKQRLEIYNLPQRVGGDVGDPIASDLSFGNLDSDNNNIAMAGVDFNRDGIDEIAVVRQMQTGKQGLFIFPPPQGLDSQMEPAIATDRTFGHRDTGRNIVAMSGLDFNADGMDEVVVIMQRTSGRQRLEIYNLPQEVGGETGDPIASDLTFGNNMGSKNNIALTSIDMYFDDIDEIAVVRQKLNGRQRLEIYHAPQVVDGETGDPIATDLTFGQAGTDRCSILISGMKY